MRPAVPPSRTWSTGRGRPVAARWPASARRGLVVDVLVRVIDLGQAYRKSAERLGGKRHTGPGRNAVSGSVFGLVAEQQHRIGIHVDSPKPLAVLEHLPKAEPLLLLLGERRPGRVKSLDLHDEPPAVPLGHEVGKNGTGRRQPGRPAMAFEPGGGALLQLVVLDRAALQHVYVEHALTRQSFAE